MARVSFLPANTFNLSKKMSSGNEREHGRNKKRNNNKNCYTNKLSGFFVLKLKYK